MGLLKAVNDSKPYQAARPDYVKPGVYVLQLDAAKVGTTRETGDTYVVVEYTVVSAQGAEANAPNSRVKSFLLLETKKNGELTQLGALNMQRLKSLGMELLGGAQAGVTAEMVTEAALIGIFKGTEFEVAQYFNNDGGFVSASAEKIYKDLLAEVAQAESIPLANITLTDLRGTLIRCEAVARVSKPKDGSAGKPFTDMYFKALSDREQAAYL